MWGEILSFAVKAAGAAYWQRAMRTARRMTFSRRMLEHVDGRRPGSVARLGDLARQAQADPAEVWLVVSVNPQTQDTQLGYASLVPLGNGYLVVMMRDAPHTFYTVTREEWERRVQNYGYQRLR